MANITIHIMPNGTNSYILSPELEISLFACMHNKATEEDLKLVSMLIKESYDNKVQLSSCKNVIHCRECFERPFRQYANTHIKPILAGHDPLQLKMDFYSDGWVRVYESVQEITWGYIVTKDLPAKLLKVGDLLCTNTTFQFKLDSPIFKAVGNMYDPDFVITSRVLWGQIDP